MARNYNTPKHWSHPQKHACLFQEPQQIPPAQGQFRRPSSPGAPCHLLGSEKEQLLPQGGDVVVTGLLHSRAAGDGLRLQAVHHAGLRGGPATWQLGPRRLWLSAAPLGPAAPAAFSPTAAPAQDLSRPGVQHRPRQLESPCYQAAFCLRLLTEPSSIFQHLAAVWALGEFPLLLCPQTGTMELYLHVMSAAGARRGRAGGAAPGGFATWLLLVVREGVTRDHLSGHGHGDFSGRAGRWSLSALEIGYFGTISRTE